MLEYRRTYCNSSDTRLELRFVCGDRVCRRDGLLDLELVFIIKYFIPGTWYLVPVT